MADVPADADPHDAAPLEDTVDTDEEGDAEDDTDGAPDASASSSKGNGRKRAPSVSRPYPRRTLEDALRIPNALKDHNGGNAFPPGEVATAVGMGPRSGTFFYLTTASRDFGLTEGTRDSESISLTALGRKAVYPGSSEERSATLLSAFFRVEIFKRVFDHYGGNKLPEEPFRTNTLITTFGLDKTIVAEFVDLFHRNCAYLGIPTGAGLEAAGTVADIAAETQVVAPSTPGRTGSQHVCFIAMPFTERHPNHPPGFFDEVLASVLKPAIAQAGFEVRTAHGQGSDVIQRTIVNELLDADLVVADLTEHNPNVLFELGLRMHSRKPIALIRAEGTAPIFDVDHMLRVESYNPNLWVSTVAVDIEKLSAHVTAAWENRERSSGYMDILRD